MPEVAALCSPILANLKSAAEIRASRSNINYNPSLSQVVAAASLSLLSQSYLTQVKLLKLVKLDVSSVTPGELASLARWPGRRAYRHCPGRCDCSPG